LSQALNLRFCKTKRQFGKPNLWFGKPKLESGKPKIGFSKSKLRWAPVATGSSATAAPAWISSLIPSTHPPATVPNLTPGTIYQFEVRVLSKIGWSDWSGNATRMAI
jgi:hypothetical protein